MSVVKFSIRLELRAAEINKSTTLLVCWLIYVVADATTYLDMHWRLRRIDKPTF